MRAFAKIVAVGVFIVGISALSQTASATTCTFGSVIFDGVSGADLTSSTACADAAGGGPLGNDTQANIDALDPFGIFDWVLADKSDGGGDNAIVLLDVVNGITSGAWRVDSLNGYTDVFLTLKSTNGYAAYLLDTAFLSGDWTTANIFTNKQGKAQAISHISLYY
ncbi:MAG: hypothetical protein JKX94_04230, partial [Sneathiella sp.]|nr:hypothetical protein [Sneathiella sp.]